MWRQHHYQGTTHTVSVVPGTTDAGKDILEHVFMSDASTLLMRAACANRQMWTNASTSSTLTNIYRQYFVLSHCNG